MNTSPKLWSSPCYPDLLVGISSGVAEGKIQLHLMDVEENKGPELLDYLPATCRDLRDQFYPDTKLQDISWRLTGGIEDSRFKVEERGSIVTRMDFESAFSIRHRPSFDTYVQAFESERGFDDAMTSGYGYMGGNAVTIVPVSLPHKNNATQFFKSNAVDDVVIADSGRLLAAWKAQTGPLPKLLQSLNTSEEAIRNTKWGSGHDAVLLSSPLKVSLDHICIQNAILATGMAEISYDTKRGLSFTNGRHRLFNAISAGAPFVPVKIADADGKRAFKEAFEWDPSAPRQPRTEPPREVRIWGFRFPVRMPGQG